MSVREDAIKSPARVPASERLAAPNPWTSIVLIACIVVLSSILCTLLLVRFLDSRTLDLRPKSQDLKSYVVGLLLEQGVPPESIESTEDAPVRDASATWVVHRVDAQLTRFQDLPPMIDIIRNGMTSRQVAVYDSTTTANESAELRLAFHGRDLLFLKLQSGSGQSDLTAASRTVRRNVLAALERMGPPSLDIDLGPAVEKASTSAKWEVAAITARVPDSIAASSVLHQVREATAHADVDVSSTVSDSEHGTLVSITYGGLECVQLRLAQAQGGAPGPFGSNLPLLGFQFAGLDIENALNVDLPDPEELPLDSADLNGDAQNQAFPEPEPREWVTPQIAIIVDDGGYGGWITERIFALDKNLTLSILPYATHSTLTAQRAEDLGFEVMLHMPMENSTGRLTFPGQITIDMTPEEIHELTLKALEEVPGAVGLNNHTGSKYTSDADAMRIFLDGIKDLPLFFVDSRTIKTSRAYDIAREMKIPCAARDLFLDHDPTPKIIKARFFQLMDIAKRHGRAIGICHFRKNTVPILECMLPEIKKAGIELVPVSEFIE